MGTSIGLLGGAAAAPITPDVRRRPVYLAGFQPNRVATAVHDELWVRALALSDGRCTVALAALDLIGLFREDARWVREELARQGIPLAGMILAATHTHGGPDTLGLWGPDRHTSGVDPAYLAWVRTRAVEVIATAVERLRPVRFRAATILAPGVARNARDPLILDEELSLLRVEDAQGKVIATVTDFPCHPEVLWDDNTQITSDFPHYLRARLEAAEDGVAIHFSGDLGGMMTPDVAAHTFAEARRVGEHLADLALTALARATPFTADRLRWREREFSVSLTNPLFRAAWEAGVIHRQMVSSEERHMVVTSAGLLSWGPVQMLAVPGEVSPRLGLRLRALLPGPYRFLIGLANDELGYILDGEEFRAPQDYWNPGEAYEESMSVGPAIGPMLHATVEALVRTDREDSKVAGAGASG